MFQLRISVIPMAEAKHLSPDIIFYDKHVLAVRNIMGGSLLFGTCIIKWH